MYPFRKSWLQLGDHYTSKCVGKYFGGTLNCFQFPPSRFPRTICMYFPRELSVYFQHESVKQYKQKMKINYSLKI